MPFPLSGPGVGIPLPQTLYPSELGAALAPYDLWSNVTALAPGDALPIPAGTFWVDSGCYSVLQYRDPVNNTWIIHPAATWNQGPIYVKSDGFNWRIANLTNCPVGGVVLAPGNGSYVQGSTTISVTGGGGSTWAPIIGGQLSGASATSVGAGYGAPPLIFIPPPAGPTNNANGVGGVQASAFCTITNGTITAVSLTNPGAGYLGVGSGTTLMGIALPNPTDPNIATGITNATIRFSVIAAGSLTGVLCTNPGNPVANTVTLAVAGAGANGTVAPVYCRTILTASITGGSTLVNASVAVPVTGVGGSWPTSTFSNSPEVLGLMARPRMANISYPIGAAGTVAAGLGTIIDGGLYFGASPTPALTPFTGLLVAGTGTIIGSSTLAFTMGGYEDIVKITPAP